MARPRKEPSAHVQARLGRQTVENLVPIVNASTRNLDDALTDLAHTGEIREARQVLASLSKAQDQAFRQQAAFQDRMLALLEGLGERLAAVERLADVRLDQLSELQQQYAERAEQTYLESHGCVVQLNEAFRVLRMQIAQLTRETPAAVLAYHSREAAA